MVGVLNELCLSDLYIPCLFGGGQGLAIIFLPPRNSFWGLLHDGHPEAIALSSSSSSHSINYFLISQRSSHIILFCTKIFHQNQNYSSLTAGLPGLLLAAELGHLSREELGGLFENQVCFIVGLPPCLSLSLLTCLTLSSVGLDGPGSPGRFCCQFPRHAAGCQATDSPLSPCQAEGLSSPAWQPPTLESEKGRGSFDHM